MSLPLGGESIERFVDREVRPDTDFLQKSRRVVDTVARFFQQADEISVKSVIVGGSLGKGTGVKHKSDVDILLVLNGYGEMRSFLSNIHRLISLLEKYVKRNIASSLPSGASYQFERVTPYSVQFQLKFYYGDDWHDVDVLPIPDVNVQGYENFYREMERSGQNKPYYAKCLTQLQIDFVKTKPAKLKDVIRFMKYWAKTFHVDIISYALELLVIWTWDRKGLPSDFSMKDMAKAVAGNLSQFGNLRISWDRNYNSSKYVSNMSSPYILDPADPFNNVIASSASSSHRIVNSGKQLLSSLQ